MSTQQPNETSDLQALTQQPSSDSTTKDDLEDVSLVRSIKLSRTNSFIIIGLTYLFAVWIGILSYKFCEPLHYLLGLLIADAVATVFVWFIGVVTQNTSVYDPYWSVAPPIMFLLFIIEQRSFSLSSYILLIAVWVWGIRLTMNWGITFTNLTIQDWRYDKFKQEHNFIVWHITNFFGLNFMPTIIVYGVMIPGFFLIYVNKDANVFTLLCMFVCIGSALLQLHADNQMRHFRKEHRGKVCNVGLWKYSRHPNYLGEICMWWGVYFMYLSVDQTYWYSFVGAVLNTLLFVFVSVPLMEVRQRKNKPDYAEYQRTTGVFIPFVFPFIRKLFRKN
ncbi:DUF1295 domain-containing protein [Entamoeba marina]